MTHNELLDALNMGITMTGNRLATHEEDALMYRKALRAVVELHKPDGYNKCSVCLDSPLADNADYPCPTIQQIIENLK